jgi:hypothetical protein
MNNIISFKQFSIDQRVLTTAQETQVKNEALQEHRHISFQTRTPSEVLDYEVELMHKKAALLPENQLANLAFEASKLASYFGDSKTASALLFNVFNEVERLNESFKADNHEHASLNEAMVSGDAGGNAEMIASGENSGAITYAGPSSKQDLELRDVIKKKLARKARKTLTESNEDFNVECEPTISNILIEKEIFKVAGIAYLVKEIKAMKRGIDELHQSMKKDVAKNQAVLGKIRKAKASGNDQALLQIIAGVLGFQLSGKVNDVTIKGRK